MRSQTNKIGKPNHIVALIVLPEVFQLRACLSCVINKARAKGIVLVDSSYELLTDTPDGCA